VVEVTEQVQESEKPEPGVVEAVLLNASGGYRARRVAAAGRGESRRGSAEEWQAEAETVEIVEAVEEEARSSQS
jgi:fused signal recognition particle receptor